MTGSPGTCAHAVVRLNAARFAKFVDASTVVLRVAFGFADSAPRGLESPPCERVKKIAMAALHRLAVRFLRIIIEKAFETGADIGSIACETATDGVLDAGMVLGEAGCSAKRKAHPARGWARRLRPRSAT
jgi:hypothetical protein